MHVSQNGKRPGEPTVSSASLPPAGGRAGEAGGGAEAAPSSALTIYSSNWAGGVL